MMFENLDLSGIILLSELNIPMICLENTLGNGGYMKIAFFDSGVGGLTVLKTAIELLPSEDYIYYADIDNVPYGTKSLDEVRKLTLDAVEFLVDKDIDALVVACNTATSAAVKILRRKYDFPVVGMEPAVKPAVNGLKSDSKRILAAGTPLTLKEYKFKSLVKKIHGEGIVDNLPLPGLVELAEKGIFDGIEVETYIKKAFAGYDIDKYSYLVLGCTHFIYYKQILKKMLPAISIIDGNIGTIKYLKTLINNNKDIGKGNGSIDIYLSGRLIKNSEKEYYMKIINRMEFIK